MPADGITPLIMTQKGIRVLDRGRNPRGALSPFWAAVGSVIAAIVLALVLLFGLR